MTFYPRRQGCGHRAEHYVQAEVLLAAYHRVQDEATKDDVPSEDDLYRLLLEAKVHAQLALVSEEVEFEVEEFHRSQVLPPRSQQERDGHV